MKKRILSLGLAAVLVLSGIICYAADIKNAVPETYEDIFKKDKVIDINIEIPEADLQDMYDYAVNEEYHSADITINGVKVENAGIRTKGNMTLSSVANSDSDRYSFRIKFNKYVKGQTYLGLDELCLNNCYSDASYMREYLHYEILEKLGMNVPKTSYCNVYINGELFGFYLAVEALDDTFLEREFGENYENGDLYKMETGSTLEYKEDENYTYAELKSGSDEELDGFKTFVKRLNEIADGEKGDTESFLNVESALKYIASNTVLCNYDSYNGNNHHNFYLYRDEDGVFTVIPWDFNMSFGGFNGSNSNVGIDTPIISGSLETLPLIGKLLSVEEYKEQYYGYIQEIMSMLEDFETRVNELKKIIKPYVENDPTAFYSVEDFEKATTLQENKNDVNQAEKPENGGNEERRAHGGGQPFGGTNSIVNCVADRLENLKAQLAGTADKTTETTGGHGGPGGGRPNGSFAPPEFGGDGENPGTPPGFGENGENPGTPPEFGGNGENREDGVPPEFGENGKIPEMGMPQGNRGDNRRPEDDADVRQPHENGKNFGGHNEREKNNVIRVHLNGRIVKFDTAPVIENDTTLVGFRAILEALGAEVDWDADTKTVTAVKEGTVITLNIGSDTAYVNGEAYTLSAAPEIVGNSTMIPVRFISEKLNMKVSWDGETKLIAVNSK